MPYDNIGPRGKLTVVGNRHLLDLYQFSMEHNLQAPLRRLGILHGLPHAERL